MRLFWQVANAAELLHNVAGLSGPRKVAIVAGAGGSRAESEAFHAVRVPTLDHHLARGGRS